MSLLTLLAVKAKTVALVAGTAAITAGAVGGGTIALSAVSQNSAAPGAGFSAATPTATVGTRGKGAENRSDTATAVLNGKGTSSPVPFASFSCNPSLNHGQNVSNYVHSLPKGPGRGRQVSQAAQSDCGKKVKVSPSASTSASPKPSESPKVKPSKAAKPTATPSKAPKPTATPSRAAKPSKAPKSGERGASGEDHGRG